MRVLRPTTKRLLRPAPLAPLAAVLVLAGCGSQTKTVSVSSTPLHDTQSQSKTASDNSTTSSSSTTTSAATSTEAEATEAQQQTTTGQTTSSRTSSAPAFVEHDKETAHGALSAAVATVEQQGYVPNDTAQYNSSQTLRVLIATKSGTNGAYTQQAFFFVDDKYIGTDASQPSASIALVTQSATEVVLEYGLYDTAQAPTGHATVHFQLDNGKLAPLDPIPPARPSASADGRL